MPRTSIDDLMTDIQRKPGRLGYQTRTHADFGTGRYALVVQELEDTPDSYYAIGERLGVPVQEVRRIAEECDLLRAEPQTPRTYAKERRIKLLDRLFERVEAFVDDVEEPLDLGRLVAATATLIDKRRLEDGEATSITESTQTTVDARAELNRRLDELSEQRRKAIKVMDDLMKPDELPSPPTETIDAEYQEVTDEQTD